MVTDTLIKKYTQSIDDLQKVDLTIDTLSLIRKFDSRYKMQINQHFSLQKKYFQSNFTKNQRLITHLFLEISSVWFCFEILILICKEYDIQKKTFLVKETRKKGNEFLVSFLNESHFKNNSNEIIKDFYSESVVLFDKISNKNLKTIFLSEIHKILNALIIANNKLGKSDYNSSIQTFIDEISEIERIYKANFNRTQKNREEYLCKHIDFECFMGFCYALRNQYVHNGLAYNFESNKDKLFVQALQNIKNCLNHLVLALAVAILKTINRNRESIPEKTNN